MIHLITQPTGNKIAREHYVDTVQNYVRIEQIEEFLSDTDKSVLNDLYPTGDIQIWGVTNSGNNASKWNKIQKGDITLFSKNKIIYSYAATTHKFKNKKLALHLWDTNSKGETWELIYTLADLKQCAVSYYEFNLAVGYKENYVIQGFNVLDEFKSARFIQTFPFHSEYLLPDADQERFYRSIEALEETEKKRFTNVRLEQSFLRKHLFGNKTVFECACCREVFPINFLVAAHIKKRSACTQEEKRDVNVVMPMCKFGCDELFEKGIVYVDKEGLFDKKHTGNSYIDKYLEMVSGQCDYFNSKTESYFRWHSNFHHSTAED